MIYLDFLKICVCMLLLCHTEHSLSLLVLFLFCFPLKSYIHELCARLNSGFLLYPQTSSKAWNPGMMEAD